MHLQLRLVMDEGSFFGFLREKILDASYSHKTQAIKQLTDGKVAGSLGMLDDCPCKMTKR